MDYDRDQAKLVIMHDVPKKTDHLPLVFTYICAKLPCLTEVLIICDQVFLTHRGFLSVSSHFLQLNNITNKNMCNKNIAKIIIEIKYIVAIL